MSDAEIASASIRVAQQGAVRTITLNRPAALNSLTREMLAAWLDALEQAAADPAVRALVITGAGRAFCAGQDLADPAVAPADGANVAHADLGRVIEDSYRPLVLRLRSMPVPVVAAVNGVAAGAGANLALAADIVLAAESASFIQAFSKIGLVPDSGGTWLLPRLVGRARAFGLAMLAEKLGAREAESIGLIWKCVPDAALAREAETLAQRLAAMPVRALVAMRGAIDDAAHLTLDAALMREAALQRALGHAHDYLEGVDAFRRKRAPIFTDR
ncbi:enoyl-CoA hydratase-related protein [Pararobbsia silviterrae]|nr:enoyl-CoA hydratase-related protein [Pararobbsia silviterrae]